ncbi:hypothetical protein BH11VER1_BH11VER1_31640 [soil metagenome]
MKTLLNLLLLITLSHACIAAIPSKKADKEAIENEGVYNITKTIIIPMEGGVWSVDVLFQWSWDTKKEVLTMHTLPVYTNEKGPRVRVINGETYSLQLVVPRDDSYRNTISDAPISDPDRYTWRLSYYTEVVLEIASPNGDKRVKTFVAKYEEEGRPFVLKKP